MAERKPLGVFEETAPLRRVLMWGQPGAEAVLGQLLPTDIGLFMDEFDVMRAGAELESARRMITDISGAEVVVIRDLWADQINRAGLQPRVSRSDLEREIAARGRMFYGCFSCEEERGGKQTCLSGVDVLEQIPAIMERDCQLYGERAAVIINHRLALMGYPSPELSTHLPIANVIYARDPGNVIGDTMVWSSMRHPIRQAEVNLNQKILDGSGTLQGLKQVCVQRNQNGEGFFEGGDGIVYNGVAYIGVGGRTDWEGVKQFAEPVLESGLRIVVVRDRARSRGEENEQEAMHLDTFFMPVDQGATVGCREEMRRRAAFEITKDGVKGLGPFDEYIDQLGLAQVPLTVAEQRSYAPNFLNLGPDHVILSLSEGNGLPDELTRLEQTVYSADLKAVTKGYGGLHCATAAISRG